MVKVQQDTDFSAKIIRTVISLRFYLILPFKPIHPIENLSF